MAGHLLVFAELYAREAGHLWWKNLSDPRPELELWSFIGGEWDEFSFVDADDAALENTRYCRKTVGPQAPHHGRGEHWCRSR